MIGEAVEDKTYVESGNGIDILICQFFGLKPVRLYAKTKKKNKDDMDLYFNNFKEIKKEFKGSKFEWMIK